MTFVFLLVFLLLFLSAPLHGQQPVTAQLDGKVWLGDQPFPRVRVTLHRVAPDGSGPLDSLITRSDGGFRFRLPSIPDPGNDDVVYFASVTHDGVNYFGSAIHLAVQLDSVYEIHVYDTEAAPAEGVQLPVRARYTILEPADGYWSATDLIRVNNTGMHTLVSTAGGATWKYPLPGGASNLEVGGDQIAADQMTLTDGGLRVTSSIAPGIHEYVVRYRVPDPYLTFSLPGFTEEMELLVKEPAPPLEVTGLVAAQPVQMEADDVYRRFVEDSLQQATVVLTKGKGEPLLPTRWLAVGLALVLALAALYSVLHPRGELVGHPDAAALARLSPFERRQMLLLEVARLDQSHDQGEIAAEEEWAARRRALLDQVQELGPRT